MDDTEKAQLTLVAFGAAGSAVALSFQRVRAERNRWLRVARAVSSFIAGICCAVLIAPLASPAVDSLLRAEAGKSQPMLGFIFGITGYELCKVIFHKAAHFLSAFVDKKERELVGDSKDKPEESEAEETDG